MDVHAIELPPLNPQPEGASLAPASRLQALSSVKAELTVRAGHVSTTVGEILALKAGQVLTMNSALNAPFDILLDGAVIARGELVAVGDQFGIRVLQTQGEPGA